MALPMPSSTMPQARVYTTHTSSSMRPACARKALINGVTASLLFAPFCRLLTKCAKQTILFFFIQTRIPYASESRTGKGFCRHARQNAVSAKVSATVAQIRNGFIYRVLSLQSLFLLAFSGSLQKRKTRKKILSQSKTVYICRTLKFKKNYHEQS